MEIHTTIRLSEFEETPKQIAELLFKVGLITTVRSEDYDIKDQPICYYAEETQYGGGLTDGSPVESKYSCWNEEVIVINFNKSEDEIFVEKQNNTNCIWDEEGETEDDYDDDSGVYALEPWFDISGAKLFEVGKRRDVTLSEFNKLCDINVLFGFAVRNIKPEEITSIEYGIGSEMFELKVIERFKPKEKRMVDFSNVKVGDVLWSVIDEEVDVTDINPKDRFPIKATAKYASTETEYDFQGRCKMALFRALFFEKPECF